MDTREENVRYIGTKKEHLECCQQLIERIGALDPNNIKCLMGLVVLKEPTQELDQIQTFIFGTDEDVAKMFTALAFIVRRGLAELNEMPGPDEVRH